MVVEKQARSLTQRNASTDTTDPPQYRPVSLVLREASKAYL